MNPVDTKLPASLWTTTPSQPLSTTTNSSTTATPTTTTTSSPSNANQQPTVASSAPTTSAVPINQQQAPPSKLREQTVARSAGGGPASLNNHSHAIQWPGLVGLAGCTDEESQGGDVGQGVYDDDDSALWSQEIPPELEEWGQWEQLRDEIEQTWLDQNPQPTPQTPGPNYPPQPSSAGVPPPTLPAQLEKGPLNHAAYVTMGSGDDNSILPKPDHSVINHLAASPIKGGFLSVGVTTRYKRKFVTIVSILSLSLCLSLS